MLDSQPAAGPALEVPALDPHVRVALDAFVARLLAHTRTTNLTAASDAASAEAHVRDSLVLVPYVRGPLVDVGSGGGFPGLVLAIASGLPCTLIEATAKKAAFLREVVRELGLAVEVVAGRAEDAGRDPALRGRFATATARAVGPATTVLELTVPLLAVGGRALLQRGRLDDAERQALHDAGLVLGAAFRGELRVAASAERRVVVAEKIAETGPRFPRRPGIPAKRPLCWTGGGTADG